MPDSVESYDVVVVGSGSAGAVVARRLVDAGASVVVLEAGGPRREPGDPRARAAVRAVGQPAGLGLSDGAAGCVRRRELHWPRGQGARRVERPERDDLRARPPQRLRHVGVPRQRRLGLRGRAPAVQALGGLRPGRVRRTTAPAGRCTCSRATSRIPVNAAVVAAAQEAGIPFNDDHNGEKLDGVAFCQLNVKDGLRQSAATAFLAPLLGAPGLTVLTGARATRLLFEGGRCVGVEIVRRRSSRAGPRRARGGRLRRHDRVARSCSCSPGIGAGAPSSAALGIDVVADLPGVGAQPPRPRAVARSSTARRRTRSAAGRRAAAAPQPPLLAQPAGAARARHPAALLPPAALPRGTGRAGRRLHADGRARPAGEPRVAAARLGRPEAAPLIDPAYLSCEADVDALVAAMELCREIGRQDALAEWQAEELYPGPGVRRGDELRDYIRSTAITYHHQVGTCKMGVDDLAVVDPSCVSTGSTGCASPTPRSCRSSPRGTRTHRR